MNVVLSGIGVSGGIGVGRAFLLHAEPLPVVARPVPPERIEHEIERFDRARARARRDIEELRARVCAQLGNPYAGILDAQLLILDDPSLVAGTLQRIRLDRVSARWALKETVDEFMQRFAAIDDEYIRERGGELSDVHRRLQRMLRGSEEHQALPAEPSVVVAHALGPSDAILLASPCVVGLVTDIGGRTSHTAILAQALALPAVVGLHDFSAVVRPGATLIVDGDSGRVTLEPDPDERAAAERRQRDWTDRDRVMASSRELPAVTRDGVEIVLRANIELPREIEGALRYGAQGIGLYRSEFLYLSLAPRLPGEQEHFEAYVEMARRVAPHPAVVRTLDLGGEKYFHDVLEGGDGRPVLGLRAVRYCLQRPDIFRPQLRGLLRAAALCENLRIMLPLVTVPDEIRQVRALLADEARRLREEGCAVREGLPLGTMIEVPAAALAADLLAAEVEFFSIGTNDLVQFALAVDRANEWLSYLYQPAHPGVLRMLRFVVEAGARARIPVAMCGEMAADPQATALLVGLGLRELSVQPRSIALVRDAIRALDAGRASRMAAELIEGPPPREAGTQPLHAGDKPARGGA